MFSAISKFITCKNQRDFLPCGVPADDCPEFIGNYFFAEATSLASFSFAAKR